jgi:intergrase/recombinase
MDVFEYSKYRKEFIEWLKIESPSNIGIYPLYLDKILTKKQISTPTELRKLINPYIKKRDRHMLNAVRTYLRFLFKTGKRRKSEVDDFRAVIPTIKTRAKSEVEKAVTPQQIVQAYNSIQGEGEIKRIRQLVFKLAVFSGLRVREIMALLNQFNPEILETTYTAFNLSDEVKQKIAVYDMETVKIPGRKEGTKRSYVAIFPRELLSEIMWLRQTGIEVRKKHLEAGRMFPQENERTTFKLKLLRTFHMNWFNDNALKVPDMPADVYRIIEFMQGRTHKDVGGRNYRANVQAAVRLYYALLEKFKKTVPIL